MTLMQVLAAEAELRHKLCPPNAWMKVLHFNMLTSCPKDELHHWFIGLYSEHIIPAIVHCYTQGITQPCLWDQRLAVELWQAPASSGWPFSRQDRMDSQNVQVWSGPARLEDQKCLEAACWRGKVQQRLQQRLKIYAMHKPDICHTWLLSKTCFSGDCVMSLALECICTYWFRLTVAISLLFLL